MATNSRPAAPRATAEATEKVRSSLRTYRGRWPALFKLIKGRNPRTRITPRWLQAFSDRKDKEPHFSKVIELGQALGVTIEITVTKGEARAAEMLELQ